jgi:anaerobic ribonucleoside-triphosphate reductase/anaerobic ribonucleoside-triphosphate reductase activating protein
MITKIRKRDGRYVKFNEDKITEAIQKAILAVDAEVTLNKVYEMTKEVVKIVEAETPEGRIPTVENVQDIVEKVLMNSKLTEVAKAYILYREERSKVREQKSKLMKTFQAIELDKKTVSNFLSRRDVFHYENPTKSILAYGREGAKEYNKMFMVDNEYIKLHEEGDIFIKEIEYYTASFNTLQLDSVKCVENRTLKGNIIAKNLKTIDDYLMCLTYIIAKAEDDLYGGVSISDFDYLLAKAVEKNHLEIYLSNVKKHLLVNKTNYHFEDVKSIENIDEILTSLGIEKEIVRNLKKLAENELEENLFNALSKFLLNIKMMPTKNQCGIINASIAYGTDESVYGRLVTKNILLATLKGLEGHLYTTPVQIFKVKEGINYNKEDKNYDLFQLAIKTQSLKMYPNFMFLDAESNKIKGVNNVRELTYGATRNRTINNKTSLGKGSISETVINLPRVALSSNNIDEFYENLKNILNKVVNQQLERFNLLSNLRAVHLPFLMIDKAWAGSDNLKTNDSIREVIKNGSLDVGFVGLAEALVALCGNHHGENNEAEKLGLEIIKFMNKHLSEASDKHQLNFQLIASSKVDLLENFVLKDQRKYGIIKHVTDKSFYTDSFHIPSNFKIKVEDKIKIEAKYHSLVSGGHITYVELGGRQEDKESAILTILQLMKKYGIGYGAINHHLDFDAECGFLGKIEEGKCPSCGRKESSLKPFFNYRRINDLLIAPINLEMIAHEEVDLRVTNINNVIRISGVVNDSIVDGPGMRFVVFTQGCLYACPGCHNPETWDLEGGYLVELDDIARMWKDNPLIEGITMSGGDPLLQPEKTLYLIKKAKEENLSVVIYSGSYYEELVNKNDPLINQILELSDILIDGPFEIDKLNLELPYRGSENQRVIDLKETRSSGKVKMYK